MSLGWSNLLKSISSTIFHGFIILSFVVITQSIIFYHPFPSLSWWTAWNLLPWSTLVTAISCLWYTHVLLYIIVFGRILHASYCSSQKAHHTLPLQVRKRVSLSSTLKEVDCITMRMPLAIDYCYRILLILLNGVLSLVKTFCISCENSYILTRWPWGIWQLF